MAGRVSWTGLDSQFRVEVEKSHGLGKELDEMKVTLQNKSDEHKTLCTAVQLVCKDLELTPT